MLIKSHCKRFRGSSSTFSRDTGPSDDEEALNITAFPVPIVLIFLGSRMFYVEGVQLPFLLLLAPFSPPH